MPKPTFPDGIPPWVRGEPDSVGGEDEPPRRTEAPATALEYRADQLGSFVLGAWRVEIQPSPKAWILGESMTGERAGFPMRADSALMAEAGLTVFGRLTGFRLHRSANIVFVELTEVWARTHRQIWFVMLELNAPVKVWEA